jgi:Zn-dependent protease with chaperone function
MNDRTFGGRLFGPGMPGGGISAIAHWAGDGTLRVQPGTSENGELRGEQPLIEAAGFNATAMRISWQGDDGPYALMVETDTDRRVCRATAPADIARQAVGADGARNRVERRFRLGWTLLALILLLPLIGIALFLLNSDRIADWAVERIPTRHEARIGDLVLAQTRLQMKIVDRGPAVDTIRTIGEKLTAGSQHSYRWFVADRPDINAFAAPGGVVVVFSGLIRSAGSAEEVAGVLAHEVAHAELRHSLRGMIKSLGLRALVSLVIGDFSGSVFADAATRLTELRFTRDAEREADDDGLRRLVAARIDPNGMLRFYEKLAAQKQLTPPAILSTHPATGERLERLRTKVAGLQERWTPLPVDLTPARTSLP